MEKQEKQYLQEKLKEHPHLKDLYKVIRKELDKTEKALQGLSVSSNTMIAEINSYLFQKAGKRIRPALLILSAKMFDYPGDEHILMSALVETIHTASLIHDDIIDNSESRRGKDTVHLRWGPNITVLLGDYLYITALGRSLHSRSRGLTQVLTDASALMIDGELKEYSLSGDLDINETDYLDILYKKTASLFAASCRIGGMLGEASEQEIELLADYGTAVGMSFQIVDDLLDYTGSKKTMGKPVLADLKEGRITLPLIATLERSEKAEQDRLKGLCRDKNLKIGNLSVILDIIKSNGALDYSYHKAQEFVQRSLAILQQLPESKYRETLALISEYILYRNR